MSRRPNPRAAGRTDRPTFVETTPPGHETRTRASALLALLALHHLHLLLKLRFQRLQIETRALLHRRVLKERLGVLRDLLLHKHEAPEFVREPRVEVQGAG